MQVKVYYSRTQLEATVKYIATHNVLLLGEHDTIRQDIQLGIQELVQRYPHISWIGRNGWYALVIISIEEGIDNDENVLDIEFVVNMTINGYIDMNDPFKFEHYHKEPL